MQGQNWFHDYLQYLSLADPNNPADSDVNWRVDARNTLTFAETGGNYTFTPAKQTLGALTHEHAGDPSDTYRIEFPHGALIIFNDFDYTNTNERGKLRYIEDVYGNRLTLTYQGGNTGKIDYITDPSGHYFRYTYLTSGDNSGKLSVIDVWKDSSTNDETERIAKLEFTYKAGGDGLDSGCGTTGDLIKVVVKTHKTGETGTTFSIQRSMHYRYWLNADSQGDDHELKMILRPEHFQRASDALGDPLYDTDADVDDYATYQFEYDANDRCSKLTSRDGALGGGGCGGCGGGGGSEGIFEFSYTTQSSSTRNDWAIRTKIEHKVSSTVMWTRYIDGNYLGEVWQDVLLSDDGDHSKPLWGQRFDRDSSTGQITTWYTPSAISDYTVATHAFSYVNDGVVYDYTYDSSAKQMASARIRKYSESTGSARYLGLWEYTASSGSFGYRTRYLLDKAYSYPTETTTSTDASRLTTDYDYVYMADSGDLDGDSNTSESTDRLLVRKTTHPTVTTGQNGPNTAGERYEYFDSPGRLRWLKDEEGAVHYTGFNALTGQATYQVRDVYTGTSEGAILPAGITAPDQDGGVDIWADWTGAAPKDLGASPAYDFQTTGSSGSYAKIASKSLPDLQGRTRRTTDNAGVATWYAYLDGESRVYPAWEGADPNKPLLPVRRSLSDDDGRSTHQITVDPTTITFTDPPDGSEGLTTQSTWITWSTTTYDSSLRRSSAKTYHDIPSSGNGSSGTNYYETAWTYADDTTNKVHTVQVRDHQGGYSKSTYNAHDQVTKVEGTATESGGSPTSWKTLTEYYYDQATPGSGASKGGNGNLTQVKSYYADASSNSTAMTYDWRHRRVLAVPPAAPYTLSKLDNLGRTVAVGTYSSAPSSSADPTSTSTNRLTLSETAFNNRGQVYQTKQWEILANGTTDSSLVTNQYYDRAGRSVAAVSPGGGARVTKFNGAGQVTQSQVCASLGSTLYSSGAFDYDSDNQIVELSVPTLDDVGRTIELYHYALKAGSNSWLTTSSPTSNSIRTLVRNYYDAVGRMTQTTQFGTFSTGGLAGPLDSGIYSTPPAYGTPESRSDTKLVTTWTYTSDGRLQQVNDPDNKATRHEYDDLGRRTAMVEDYGGLGRRTEYQYNGNSDTTKLIARDVGEYGYDGGDALEDQVTQYVYGHAVNSRWVTEIRYPGSDGQASSSASDKVVFTYNNDGTVATRTDQNQSVITYEYDTLRRKTHERVTTVGTGVNDSVRRLSTTYTDRGQVEKLSSYDNATVGSGSVVNEVKFTYNGFGQLTKDEQDPNGVVDGSTLNVQYAWSEDAGSNHSRLTSMTYPNGRVLYMRYTHADASTTKQDEVDDAFSRIGQLAADPNTDVYTQYTFNGLSRMTERASKSGSGWKGNNTALNLDPNTAGQYAGLDILGRTVAQKVKDGGNTLTRTDIQYQSNRDGSPQFAEPQSAVVLGRSDLYTYDGLHRLSQADTGKLNSGRADILDEWPDPAQTVYTMDILGNFTSIDHKHSGTSAAETRTHNATNELTGRTITQQAPQYWVNDDFADNDTVGYAVADLNTGGGDGTWSAASGQLQNDTVIAVTGAPDTGNGSILLVGGTTGGPYYQDVKLAASLTLSGSADNGGLVFGYRDKDNFWVLIASRVSTRVRLYEVSSGTWTQRDTSGLGVISGSGGTYTITLEARSGSVCEMGPGTSRSFDASAPIPAGAVGLWAGSGSAGVQFDDFTVRNLAAFCLVDGRFIDDVGNVRVSGGKLEFYNSDGLTRRTVLEHFRQGKGITQAELTFRTGIDAGIILHYQDPENFLVALLDDNGSGTITPRLVKYADGKKQASLASGSTFSLTDTAAYTLKCTVNDDPGNSALQELNLYVGGTLRLTTTAVDDTWSAGQVGLFRTTNSSTTTLQWDDFACGQDRDVDGTLGTWSSGTFTADSGDWVAAAYNFNDPGGGVTWQKLTLSYDDNGNLTDDGLRKYKYDAWNRLRGATYNGWDAGDPNQWIADYRYYADTRRAKKIVQNRGGETYPNDGGNTTVDSYWGAVGGTGVSPVSGRLAETRNGSNQTTWQYVWGGDGAILCDKNGDVTASNDVTIDVTAGGESTESPADHRYYFHQDRVGNVVALTDHDVDPNNAANGRIAERCTHRVASWLYMFGGSGNGVESSIIGRHSPIGALQYGSSEPIGDSPPLWQPEPPPSSPCPTTEPLKECTPTTGCCCNDPISACHICIRTESGGFAGVPPGQCAACDAMISTKKTGTGTPMQSPCWGGRVLKITNGCSVTGRCSAGGSWGQNHNGCHTNFQACYFLLFGGCVDKWW